MLDLSLVFALSLRLLVLGADTVGSLLGLILLAPRLEVVVVNAHGLADLVAKSIVIGSTEFLLALSQYSGIH